jgi:hypothetical protein
MAEEDTAAAPAGESGPLTESAAASLLAEWKDEPEEKSPKVDSSRASANAADDTPAEAEGEAEAEPAESTETDTESEDGADPEADSDSEDGWVHGNARTRLRDGTAVTVGELKKLADEAKEFKRNQAEYAAQQQREQREVQAKVAQIAQQEHFFATTLQQAIGALQQQLPPEPDQALRETDPIDYFLKKDQREAKIAEIRNLQMAQEHATQQSRAEQAHQFSNHLQSEQSRLLEKAPELKDEGKRREFYSDLVSYGKKYYDFAENEINSIHDSRVMRMAKDAIAYRKLQANKPRVMEKGKAATPVAKPGVRTSSNERVSTKHKGLFEQARKTRSIDDVGKLLAELE